MLAAQVLLGPDSVEFRNRKDEVPVARLRFNDLENVCGNSLKRKEEPEKLVSGIDVCRSSKNGNGISSSCNVKKLSIQYLD